MQRLRKAIKRMAALGTGVAMLGATITGAVAQNLANYPQPFIDVNGVFNTDTAIVVGENAAASDTLGAVDIAQQLQFDAKTPVSSSEGTVSVSGGVTEDIPLGSAIANDTTFTLDWQLDDSDIDSFLDTAINFQGEDYDVHDELAISRDSPTAETSLTSSDDDYETNIFLETGRKKITYWYAFDDPINVSDATADDPLELKFMGKTLKVTTVDKTDKSKFTANVGSEFFMDAGDVVTVDGKKITLVNVGEGGAIVVDVDGVLETISSSSTETINGIEVKNDETFYTNEKSERSAALIIGEDAVDTFKDSDAYVGEDESDPDWIWRVGNLGVKATTSITNSSSGSNPTGPFIGVTNEFVKNDDSDDPAGIGECYDLPNNYVSICFDSLTVADNNYLEVTIEFEQGVDTAKSKHFAPATTSAKTIRISAPGDERFVFRNQSGGAWDFLNFSAVDGKKTGEVFIQTFASIVHGYNGMVFFTDKNANPTLQYAGNISFANGTFGGGKFMELLFDDTKDANMEFSVFNYTGVANRVALKLNWTGDSTTELPRGADSLVINWSLSSGDINSLGTSASQEEATEVIWRNSAPGQAITDLTLGTKDEDHRGKYGWILKDPKSNGASDQVILQVPGDMVQANIVVKGASTLVTGGATSYLPADIDINTRLDSEVAGSESNFDLILVGGPCANDAVEAVGVITCEGARAAWSPGQGVLQMASNGANVALLVAGYNAIDTRVAAKVISNYGDYDLSGSSVKVTGTLNNPSVSTA